MSRVRLLIEDSAADIGSFSMERLLPFRQKKERWLFWS